MRKILFLFAIIFFSGCSSRKNDGGIIFTFDDQYISDWVSCRNLFKKYDIKATFFIYRPQLLDSDQIKGLNLLKKDGHEIACHGMNHIDSQNYADSAYKYYEDEVAPAIKKLNELGFQIVSFAYPFGKSPATVDSFLQKHIRYLRKATWNINDTTIDTYNEIYARKNSFNIVSSMGIDFNYKITPENLETGIIRAIKNNEVLVLHSHKIDSSDMNYTIRPEYLEQVFELCKKHKIRSLRIKDLAAFYK